MNALILHIPHSSRLIPYYDGFIVGKTELMGEIKLLTDSYTDELFHAPGTITIKANFSRIFCDVERFQDDKFEVMGKKGMGVLYTHADCGKLIRIVTPRLRTRVLKEFYIPHHQRLTNAVKTNLKLYGSAMIIDCHSFTDSPFNRDADRRTPRPDFNVGTDHFHTPEILVAFASAFFQQRGFSVGIDWPYSGAIVPIEFFKKDSRVSSIMIEVNRRLYLKNGSDKSGKYNEIKKLIGEFITSLQRLSFD